MVEDVDPDYADMDPNADNKNDSGHQSPYGNPGENLTGWAYSEFLWTHSCPVGNGRMAGMIAGGIDKEIIQINDNSKHICLVYKCVFLCGGDRWVRTTDLLHVKQAL